MLLIGREKPAFKSTGRHQRCVPIILISWTCGSSHAVSSVWVNEVIFSLTHLHMPLLAHGIDDTPLDGSPTGTADWHTHLVMAGQTVELPLQFPGIGCKFLPVDRETLSSILQVRQTDSWAQCLHIKCHKMETNTGFETSLVHKVLCGTEMHCQAEAVLLSVLNGGV